jgi:poly-gamma-glutamate capsule biosynthesis protein CapA/YwtB (metallophosphatase superfamily)
MAIGEDLSEQGLRLGPQTAAARRRAKSVPEAPVEDPVEPLGPLTPVARELAEIEETDEEPAVVATPVEPEPEPEPAAPPPPPPEVEPEASAPPAQPAPPGVRARPRPARPRPARARSTRRGYEPLFPPVPAPAPPARPERPARNRPTRPAGPPPGAAVAALTTLGSALAMLLFLVSSVGSEHATPLSATASLEAKPSLTEVAPGGRIALSGTGAPAGTPIVLETRSGDDDWRSAGRASANSAGEFRLSGRVAAAPGTVMVRAWAERGEAASDPVAVTVRPLRLSSVGDINLGDVPGANIATEGPRYPWTSAGRALAGADIAFGNLECAISKRGTPFEKLYNFRGTPAALRGLARHSGLDVLNLANNHAGDYGPVALLDTVRGIERLGMKAVGAGRNLRRALKPQIVERLGLRVAFVGFSEVAPVEFAASADRAGTAWATPEAVTAAVHRARRRADVVVATFHWGVEKAATESAAQQALATAAADAGAQLVIGAHPHVLQPLRRQGSAVVAYSLGNFVFGAVSDETTATGILETDLTSEGVAAARWRKGTITAGRPQLDRSRPEALPLDDPAVMTAGVSL